MSKKRESPVSDQLDARAAAVPRTDAVPLSAWIAIAAGLSALMLWAFWPTAYRLFRDWQGDPNYSVGQLVPLAALYILWDKRGVWRNCTIRPCWWGLAVCLAALALWYGGLLFLYESAERYALVLMIVGLVLWIGGRRFFRTIFWVVLLLFLMVPLPGRIHNAVAGPLQQFATASTVFLLEVGGVDVIREGNTLSLGTDTRVGIAEACSGLRMLTAFVIVAAAFALLVERPRWQKIFVLLSSIPIAILCNMLRLIATVIIYKTGSSTAAESFFHDFAGLTMMPTAVLLIFGELSLLKRLVVEEPRRA
jgi:exosortase